MKYNLLIGISILGLLCASFLSLFALLPAICLLWILKKTSEFSNIKLPDVFIILFSAFLLPFLSYIYILKWGADSVFPSIISLTWAFILVPALFVISLINIFVRRKKDIRLLATSVLMFFVFLGFIYHGIKFTDSISDKRDALNFVEYENFIKFLNDYKVKNGVYPKNLEKIKLPSGEYNCTLYETKENGKDFIIKFLYSDTFYEGYMYCSSDKYKECKPHKDYPIEYVQRGKWLEIINHD